MAGYINTIADLEAQTYGTSAIGGFGNQLLKATGGVQALHGGHDQTLGIGTGTTTAATGDLYNKIYGQKVW